MTTKNMNTYVYTSDAVSRKHCKEKISWIGGLNPYNLHISRVQNIPICEILQKLIKVAAKMAEAI